ncbi:MAG: hypothetical protein KDA96_23315 [Planctomycetaceae bacterium]|nr:hypothetical protein [Planctomycetaceae bacterium]MCA9066025.1 hypothetical protein [Planctomycetaceae bacterium]
MFHRVARSFFTTLSRFLLSAWIGAAALFVITSVAEQSSPDVDSVMRDRLATIRFPHYYRFGAWVVATGLICTTAAAVLNRGCLRRRLGAAALVLMVSGGIAIWDYYQVYLPLQAMITPPGQSRPLEFIDLHKKSARINTIHLSIAFVAAALACSPGRVSGGSGCGSLTEKQE